MLCLLFEAKPESAEDKSVLRVKTFRNLETTKRYFQPFLHEAFLEYFAIFVF